MKRKCLAYLFFFLFSTETLLSLAAAADLLTSKDRGLTQGLKVYGANGTVGFYGEGDRRGLYEGKHDLFADKKKAQRGRSAGGGGASLIRRPHDNEKAAAMLTARPSFFISAVVGYVSFNLPLPFFLF